MGFLTLSLDSEVAVRLAHEGVPVRVIARATRIPSDEVRRQLQDARTAGRLPELPSDDWSLPAPRQPSAPSLNDPVLVAQKVFRLTPTQATLFLLLLRSQTVDKYSSIVSPDCFDVHVCALRRRLAVFNLRVKTVRGYGYQLEIKSRRRAADLISQHIAAQAIL